MRIPKWLVMVAVLAAMVGMLGLVYRMPPVHNRLSWRIDFGLTYLRRLANPIGAMPTALPAPETYVVRPPGDAEAAIAAHRTPVASLTSTAAATPTRQVTPTPTLSPTPVPESVLLPAPEWEKQDINACGPAALTMYLRFFGWEGDQEKITQVIKPFREDRNVNVEELVYYVRNYAGWLNVQYRVGGDLATLKALIAAGIPVMIEESFYFDEAYWPNDDLWAAHYQLVTGYDNVSQTFIGQDSFHGPDRRIPYQKLDEYWQAFNRVYIMVYTPQQEGTVQAILGENWDPDVNRRNALKVARAETQADPDNAFAWFNLGNNLSYFEDYIEATDAFDKARDLGLPQRMLRYQFTPYMAYFHTGQIDDLLAITSYALEITPNGEESLLWHGWAMYRQGKMEQAIADFQQALVENPNYQDAQYALDYIANNP